MIALTVDNTTGRNSETYLRTRPKDLHSAPPAMWANLWIASTNGPCTTAST